MGVRVTKGRKIRRDFFMLIIQKICLQWGKEERGADGDKVRRRFSHAYPLAPQTAQGDVLVQNLDFYQHKSTILDAIQEVKYLTEKYRPQWEQRGQTPGWIQREMNDRIAYIKRNQYQNYTSIQDVNLANLYICREEDRLKLSFGYDERRCGAPFRRGHNKDYHNQDSPFYARDVLNETAFMLSQGQYGQILWNERCTDCDEGTWYYQLHIYNLYYLQSQDIPGDLFTAKVPDHQYQQLASLY